MHEDLVWLLEVSVMCDDAGFLRAATLQDARLFTPIVVQPCVSEAGARDTQGMLGVAERSRRYRSNTTPRASVCSASSSPEHSRRTRSDACFHPKRSTAGR